MSNKTYPRRIVREPHPDDEWLLRALDAVIRSHDRMAHEIDNERVKHGDKSNDDR